MHATRPKTRYQAARRYAPANGSSMVAKIDADLRPATEGAQSAHLRWLMMAKLQAASVPIA